MEWEVLYPGNGETANKSKDGRSPACSSNQLSKTESAQVFSELADAARNQIERSSVCLRNGRFVGSGTLVKDSEGIAGIITAKHNLYVNAAAEQPIDWDDTQVNDRVYAFLTDLVVHYSDTTQELTPTTSDIEFRAGYESWDYDLMFISFKADLPIRTYVNSDASHRIAYGERDLGFYRHNMVGKTVFVTGFGDVMDSQGRQTSLSHPFQVRCAEVTASEPLVRRHADPNADNCNALILTASNNSSTAPGDSGGGVFTVTERGQVYLLGASLGSNFVKNEMPPDEPTINNACTSIYYQGALF